MNATLPMEAATVIIGLAGHIDHGKSTLVEALTGTHPDRLEEEKRRGITIDLGFAHCELIGPRGQRWEASFVDVPGHERFIANLLAGIGGIDLALLVIAADAGIQPQTREHYEICRLLGIRQGVVALSKADLADEETIARRREEIRQWLAGGFLADAPLIAVSPRNGQGLQELRNALAATAAQTARDPQAPVRLPIDRAFTMKGFGAVVTGTLLEGSIQAGDELAVAGQPGRKLRVRGVQVHGRTAARAVAGQRTALNLHGVEAGELRRGDFMITPGSGNTTARIHARLEWLAAPPDRHVNRLRLHVHSAETMAGVMRLAESTESWAQLRLDSPLPLLPGDRFILRQLSPALTLGGGVVVDPLPLKTKWKDIATTEHVHWLARQPPWRTEFAAWLRWLCEARPEGGWQWAELAARCGASVEQIQARIRALTTPGGEFCWLETSQSLWPRQRLEHWEQTAFTELEQWQAAHPLQPGITLEAWRGLLEKKLTISAEVLRDVSERLRAKGRIEAVEQYWRLAGQGVRLNQQETAAREKIEAAFRQAGWRAPAAAEVLAQSGVDAGRAGQILQILLRERVLVSISSDLILHREALAQLRQLLAEYKQRSARIQIADFKQLTGVSRKYAIPLLEHLDRMRVTRRAGDAREIL